MGYYNKMRHRLSDSLLETKVLLILSLILIIAAIFIPELTGGVTSFFSSILPLWLGGIIGPVSIVGFMVSVLLGYIVFFSGIVRLLWAIDTSRLENKLNCNVSSITTLLGLSSYIQLRAEGNALNDFHKFLSSQPNNIQKISWIRRSLLGKYHNEETPRGWIQKNLNLSIWELIFLSNYIRILETAIRQSTQAPTNILEYPISLTMDDIPIPRGVGVPFDAVEMEIIAHRIQVATEFSWLRRTKYRFRKSWIDPVVLLDKGISAKDYTTGKLKDIVKILASLAGSTGEMPPIVSRESISNIIRFADKQYDFEVGQINTDIETSVIWSLQWLKNKTKNTVVTDSISKGSSPSSKKVEGPILELGNVEDFRFALVRNNNPRPALAPTVLDIEGYQIDTDDGTHDAFRIIDNISTTEVLDRTQRLLLQDLFENVVDGNALHIQDPSNIRMILEAFSNRQFAIQNAIETGTLSKPKSIPRILLHLNAFAQSSLQSKDSEKDDPLFNRMRIDQIKSNQTLSTVGLLGLKCVEPPTREGILGFINEKTGIEIADLRKLVSESHDVREESHLFDIPQLELKKSKRDLSETRKTEQLTEVDALVWAATGAGAWIIKRNHMHYFTKPVEDDKNRGLLLVHHPLRERIFLETITHRNYHYLWEILRNRIEFQEITHLAKKGGKPMSNVEFVWVRESFLPSGNSFLLNDESKKILKTITDVYEKEQKRPPDYCVMLTRSNQMIRGPINGLNMIFIENSKALSPLPAITSDLVLRQRMFEELARRISRQTDILTEEKKPTPFIYAINWLRPLERNESLFQKVSFENHSFSNPSTWNDLGFLDILVKESKCAYALIKVLSSYMSMLRSVQNLPFKLMQEYPGASTTQDIDHLSSSYDLLCDFLTGEGDFSKEGVYAIGEDKGYLDWLEKALLQLPSIGLALGIQEPFDTCVKACIGWMKKLFAFLEQTEDPLKTRVEELLRSVK